ncbi:hypothetical protein ACWG5N_29710, partial [Streptomyces globisporus]
MTVPDALAADEIPQGLVASYATGFGEEGSAWIAGLPSLAADLEVISFGEPAVADEGAGDAGEGEEVVGLAFVA